MTNQIFAIERFLQFSLGVSFGMAVLLFAGVDDLVTFVVGGALITGNALGRWLP